MRLHRRHLRPHHAPRGRHLQSWEVDRRVLSAKSADAAQRAEGGRIGAETSLSIKAVM